MRMSSVAHDEINELSNAADSMQSPDTFYNVREQSPSPVNHNFDHRRFNSNQQIEEEHPNSDVIV